MGTVISRDGTGIVFDRYGHGPPVVLVGGAFQYRAFDPRTAELAKLVSVSSASGMGPVEGFSAMSMGPPGRQ